MSNTISKSYLRAPKTTGDLLLADDDVQEYADYEYEPDDDHLTESQAAERYKAAKALHPDAIVSLDPLSCGHYAVNIQKTDWQKQLFYKRAYSNMLRRALDRLLGAFENPASK